MICEGILIYETREFAFLKLA